MAPVLDHTSVPKWARAPTAQPVDPAAASATILSFSATALATGWSSDLTDLGIEHRTVELAPGDSAEERYILTAELQRAVVGWRLLLAGPLADVLRGRSRALQAGLLAAEVIVGTTAVDLIPVSCAHCAATTLTSAQTLTLTTARAPQRLTCAGCAQPLVVHDHLSPLRGGFLGVTPAPGRRLDPTGEPA